MKSIVIAFYGEGSVEYKFLVPIVERTLVDLVPFVDVSVFPLDGIKSDLSGLRQAEKMLHVAREASGYTLIVFHLDADGPDTRRAYEERFAPGYQQILHSGEQVNSNVVPVIPVRMTEAWTLVDFEAFRSVTKTKLGFQDLGFVSHPHQVESIPNPRSVLRSALRNAQPGRRRSIRADDIYIPLALRIDLERLRRVPAYQEFVNHLKNTLHELDYLLEH